VASVASRRSPAFAIQQQPPKGSIMLRIAATSLSTILLCASAIVSATALAADVTYRKDILPLWQAKCGACHGAQAPYFGNFLENEKKYRQEMKGPRMDTYADLLSFVGWPDTGAIMRRLDDGSNIAERKPGNMYQYLGTSDAERQANLKLFKAWIGEDAWVLKRWEKKDDVPAVTKGELDKIKAKY
jgi:mono/diheme cytochrome c family protein